MNVMCGEFDGNASSIHACASASPFERVNVVGRKLHPVISEGANARPLIGEPCTNDMISGRLVAAMSTRPDAVDGIAAAASATDRIEFSVPELCH